MNATPLSAKHDPDAEAEAYFASETAAYSAANPVARRRRRLTDIVFTVLFLAMIFGMAAAHFIASDENFSDSENRFLTQLPKADGVSSLLDGTFTSELSEYFSDQFPARNFFLGLRAVSELALGKCENNDVILGSGGTLLRREECDLAAAEENLAAVKLLFSRLAQRGMTLCAAIAPRGIDYGADRLPLLYPAYDGENFTAALASKVSGALGDAPSVDLYSVLRAADDENYLYYRTDHHFTALGAYYAYTAIAPHLGIAPYPPDSFTEQVFADDFYGTGYSRACLWFVRPDTLSLFRYDGDSAFITTVPELGKESDGLYDFSAASRRDKYSVYLGGNYARVDITSTADDNRPTLLIIKDSFAHAVAPYLARHFNLVMVDMRYYNGSVSALADDIEADAALVLLSAPTLCEKDVLALLALE